MAVYVAMGQVYFDGAEAWAEGQAKHLHDQAKALATTAAVVAMGTQSERTSYFGAYRLEADGTLVPVALWHLDVFGIVRSGMLVAYVDHPDWIQPTGAHDAYPLLDRAGHPARVRHQGAIWQNTVAANIWQPGVYGWVPAP
jgi:hypothetical protein